MGSLPSPAAWLSPKHLAGAAAAFGNRLEMQILSPIPDLPNQNLWGRPQSVFTTPQGVLRGWGSEGLRSENHGCMTPGPV